MTTRDTANPDPCTSRMDYFTSFIHTCWVLKNTRQYKYCLGGHYVKDILHHSTMNMRKRLEYQICRVRGHYMGEGKQIETRDTEQVIFGFDDW